MNSILFFPAIFFITIQIVVTEPLSAQDIHKNNFVRYSKSDGLSNNDITGIAQDSVGYIWASTSSGLNRFNGSEFVQFHPGNDSLSLPAEDIFVLARLGFYHFDRDYHLVFRFDYYKTEEASNSYFAFGRHLLWLDE